MFSRANPFDESVSKYSAWSSIIKEMFVYLQKKISRCNKRKPHRRKLGTYLGSNRQDHSRFTRKVSILDDIELRFATSLLIPLYHL